MPPVQEDAPAQPEEPLAPPEDHPDAAADAPGGGDEEVPGRDYFEEDQNGRIMEVDEEGNLRSSLPSPTPAQEPVPPPEYQAPQMDDDEDLIQYDGYYSGGMWDDSDAEEEPLELTGGPGAPDGGDEDSVNPQHRPEMHDSRLSSGHRGRSTT